jgi:hypothetical protein
MAAEHPEAILGLPGIQITPGESTAATGILTRAINPTGAQLRLNRHRFQCSPGWGSIRVY